MCLDWFKHLRLLWLQFSNLYLWYCEIIICLKLNSADLVIFLINANTNKLKIWPVRYLWSDLTWWHSEYQLADGCWPLSRPHRRILWPRHWRPQSHLGLQMRARRPPGVAMLTPREHSKSYSPWSSLNWMMMNLLAWCWLLWGTWSTHGKKTCSDNRRNMWDNSYDVTCIVDSLFSFTFN